MKPHARHLKEWNSFEVREATSKGGSKGIDFTSDPDIDNPKLNVVYGCAWDEIFFKVMLTSILLDELEKIADFIDFNNTKHIQKINKRK